MGRGQVQPKLIENTINRQVTFSKRKAGLLKKANEISVLCEAEVALIVFSYNGKFFDYATASCMEPILERHESYSYAERQLTANDSDSSGKWTLEYTKLKAKIQLLERNHRMDPILERHESYSYAERQLTANDSDSSGKWTLEYTKLKAKIQLLERNHRHYMGEDLDSLSLKELQSLEQQLDTGLKHIRSRKNQLMYKSVSELQKKEKEIHEQNNMLAKQIKEKEKEKTMAQQMEEEQQNHGFNSSLFLSQQPVPRLNIWW